MHIEYRPQTLDEIFGNKHIISVLKDMGQFRPIMFEGMRGSVKTTLAYITAKMFGANDQTIEDINCVHFSKKEDMEGILEPLFKSSIFGDKKVLILDELHEVSPKAQQLLLKPL